MCMHLHTLVPLLRTFPLVSIVELRVDRSQSTQNRSAPAYIDASPDGNYLPVLLPER